MYTTLFPSRSSSSLLDLIDRQFDFANFHESRIDASRYQTESTEADHRIRIALPGHSKESIKISVENGKLLVTADPLAGSSSLCRAESFRFSLPKTCNLEEIDAQVQNGILEIVIAKVSDKKAAKRIEVTVN